MRKEEKKKDTNNEKRRQQGIESLRKGERIGENEK